MPIISSEITENSLQAHGQRYVREKHTDHIGREYLHSYATKENADIEQAMNDRIPSVNNMLIEKEITEVVKIIEDGEVLPKLEFATLTQVKSAFLTEKANYEKEITTLTIKKTNLETGAT